jgi:hypothetical protein
MTPPAILILGILCVSTLSAQEVNKGTNQDAKTATKASAPAPAKLLIDPQGPVKAFAPSFAGLMTEEINHS